MVAFRDQNLKNFLRRPAVSPREPRQTAVSSSPDSRQPLLTTRQISPATMTTIVTERDLFVLNEGSAVPSPSENRHRVSLAVYITANYTR
jgi:hypothetical protein